MKGHKKRIQSARKEAQSHALSVALVRSHSSPSPSPSPSSLPSSASRTKTKATQVKTIKALDHDNSVASSMRGGATLTTTISKRRGWKGKNGKGRNINKQKPFHNNVIDDMVQFVNDHRTQVGNLGASALDKKSAKEYEIEKLVKLGCKRPKNIKMPLQMLQNKRANERKKEEKQRELDRQNGIYNKIKSKVAGKKRR